MMRQDSPERLSFARQQLGFLEKDNLILQSKIGQCFVDVVLVVGVVGE